MKKEYLNPQIMVVKLRTMGVLAGSPVTMQVSSKGVDNGSALSSEIFGDSDDSEEW